MQRDYEAGCSKTVLYQYEGGEYTNGVPWNGVTGISLNIEGGELTPLYSGNKRVSNAVSSVEYGLSLKCYSYPEEFEPCIGETEVTPGVIIDQQDRQIFGISYQTKNGNAYDPDAGYTIHMIYGCTVSSADYEYSTINSNLDPVEFTFEIETIPEYYEGFNALAHLKVKSLSANSKRLTTLETILYGTNKIDPRMPLPEEVAAIISGTDAILYPNSDLYPNVDLIPV